MNVIGIIGSKYSQLIRDKIKQLGVENLEVIDYLNSPDGFQGLEIVIFCDLDLTKIDGDKDEFLDKLTCALEKTKKLLLVNLSDEWVAEVTKDVMKHSRVTVLDYSKNKFEGVGEDLNPIYALGLNLGLSKSEIDEKLK